MSELAQAIEEMRNMRESYDQLAATADLYQQGRTALADAITAKGVPTTADTPLADMAQNVADISQVVREIDGGEMYAQQLTGDANAANAPLWNLYEVLVQLKNQYLVSSGGNYQGILLGRFYRGYASIALSGADAYVVSDGDFYENSVTHVWHSDANANKHLDRWVAYLFSNSEADFVINTSSLCPRDIFIGGAVGTIYFHANGHLGSIVCGLEETDTLNELKVGSYTNPWSKDVVINGIKQHSGEAIKFSTNCENVVIGIEKYVHASNSLANLLVNNTDTNIITFCAPRLQRISASYSDGRNYQTFRYNTNIVSVKLPSLTYAYCTGTGGKLLNLAYGGEQPRLIDLEVGAMTTGLYTNWNPTAVLADANTKATLIDNIKNHILAKVSDRTGLSRLTFTVSTNMFNAISGETITWNDEEMTLADAFLTKNWLLAGA